MARYVAFLRGINVGRNKRVAMSDLRALLEGLGFTDVATVLQSGNALFTTSRRGADAIGRDIEAAIADRLKMDVRVIVRSLRDVAAAVDANPLPEAASKDPTRYLVSFLSANPSRAAIDAIDHAALAPEEVRFGDKVMYAWHPNGIIESRLGKVVSEKTLGVVATARNWATLTKILDRG